MFFKVGDIETVFVLLVLDRVVSTILADPDEETMPGDFHFETVVDWESIWVVCVA